jgi:hypothetical protein
MVDLSPQQRSPSPLQASPLEKEAPSTPIIEAPSTPISHESTSLEERVTELEFKLATLSRLLALQRNTALTPRAISPLANERNNTPYLESPAPSRRQSSRNLLLRDYDEQDLVVVPSTADSDVDPSIHDTASLARTDNNMPPPPPTTVVMTTTDFHSPEPPPKKSTKQKWMDYLNTFQESDVDVDVQMQEFIRVPSQLEYLLGYGFWICVDCFLYILTILPIRFCWSCLLLSGVLRGRFHRR